MKPTDFQRWLTQSDELTPFQGERALETLTSQNPERTCTDGSKAFKAMAKDAGIPHQAMNIKAGIRVKERIFHIQNVNA